MEDDKMPHITEAQISQVVQAAYIERKGPIIQSRNGPIFLEVLTYACDALIACTKQLNIMDEEYGDGNYGSILEQNAKAIRIAIQEGEISKTRPFIIFTQISRIIERSSDSLEGGIYSLFFDAVAKSFLKFQNEEPLTAYMWLTALTFAIKTIGEISKTSLGDRTMLDALIPAERKLREALDSGLTHINAFGRAVEAAEISAMQTQYIPAPRRVDFKNEKSCKYPDPGAHAVGIWMRAAYEGVKLKFGHQYNSV